MGSPSRSSEASRRRSVADHDDTVPSFYRIPVRPPSPPVVVTSVPFSFKSGNSWFHFDPSDGSVRRTTEPESPPPRSSDYEFLLKHFFETSPTTATSGPWRSFSSSATVSTGADHSNGIRNQTRPAAAAGEGSRRWSTGNTSGGSSSSNSSSRPGRTASATGVTSAPPPRRARPCDQNDDDDNNSSNNNNNINYYDNPDHVEVEKEEEVLRESKLLLGIPQNPHYRPLQHLSKGVRQHLIASYDKCLVEVGRRIQKVTAEGLERYKEDLRGTLQELDKMGYNVGPLVRRLDSLEETVGRVAREASAAREKLREARRKVGVREEEQRELREEIRRVQTRAEEKREAIQELVDWITELEEVGLLDADHVFAQMALIPLEL